MGKEPQTNNQINGLSRRQFFTALMVGGFTPFLSATACGRTQVMTPCSSTPSQTEGPFYPVTEQLDVDNDLTFILGQEGEPEGQILFVEGQILDAQCQPLEGARVEIWQASARGRYHHPLDESNPIPLDKNFQGWGHTFSDQEGRYVFKTVRPGQYPATPEWIRPSHIHFKVTRSGFPNLTTQMYFAGDPHLELDRIFQALRPDDRPRVVVDTVPAGPRYPSGSVVYHFPIVLPS